MITEDRNQPFLHWLNTPVINSAQFRGEESSNLSISCNNVNSTSSINIYLYLHWPPLTKSKPISLSKILNILKLLTFLEGPFQSDALLVPEHCLFDHIHNQTKCWNFDQWNSTAGHACSDRGMKLRSFAMLLPCGIDVFSGVEFVCCPAKKARKGKLLWSLRSVGFLFYHF